MQVTKGHSKWHDLTNTANTALAQWRAGKKCVHLQKSVGFVYDTSAERPGVHVPTGVINWRL